MGCCEQLPRKPRAAGIRQGAEISLGTSSPLRKGGQDGVVLLHSSPLCWIQVLCISPACPKPLPAGQASCSPWPRADAISKAAPTHSVVVQHWQLKRQLVLTLIPPPKSHLSHLRHLQCHCKFAGLGPLVGPHLGPLSWNPPSGCPCQFSPSQGEGPRRGSRLACRSEPGTW